MGNHRAERAPKRRTSATPAPVNGKRRAEAPRRSTVRLRSLPSLPLVAGVAVLAISAGGAVTASGQLDGALVAAGGGLFLANRIDDAFAVAKVGAPGVDVLFENRVVARSDARGNALVPGLRSYQANKISIDSRDLPVNANPSSTQEVLAPPDRAGVVVDFGVRSVVTSAVVILRGGDGAPLQPGLRGRLLHDLRGVSNDAEDFTIGYEGRAFIHHLGPENTVVVTLPTGECRARFPFAPRNDRQVEIGPVPCL